MTSGVVLHLTEAEPSKQVAVLRNARNLLPEVPPGTRIEVVVHGEALGLARRGGPAATALAEAFEEGITLAVCRNSMRSQGLSDEDLVPGATPVSSGVAHLVARQRDGWAYLRP